MTFYDYTIYFSHISYIILMWYTRNIFFIYFFINWAVRMRDNLLERVQILGHAHIICITVRENRIICCQIFCDLLLESAFERIFNIMQLILIKIKWHIKWKYLIQKLHDIRLSYYFRYLQIINIITLTLFVLYNVFALNRLHFTRLEGNNPYETDIKINTYRFINKSGMCSYMWSNLFWEI